MRNGVLLMAASRRARRSPTRGGNVVEARRHVLDQRLRHVLALEHRDDASSGSATASDDADLACATSPRTSPRLALCLTILAVTVLEKFAEGGWLTLVITGALVALCFAIKRHYGLVVRALKKLDEDLPSPPEVEIARVSRSGLSQRRLCGGPDGRSPRAPQLARSRSEEAGRDAARRRI